MKPIYFDNNATTMVAPEVTEAMIPFFKEYWGNPSSMHTFGGQVAKYVDEGRQKVADMLNCHPQEIIFTSCATESDNTAIWSALQTQPTKRHIITTAVEHPAILKNIIAHLGTQDFPRIKIGTGAPSGGGAEMIDWVIGVPSQAERKILVESFETAIKAAEDIIENGCQKAMNDYN